MTRHWQKIVLVALFGIFFGLLESIVVIYLRDLFGSGNTLVSPKIIKDDIIFSLGFISFLKPSASLLIAGSLRLLSLELWRELSTIVMLLSLSLIAGKSIKEKLAYFLLVFGIWDIFYYVFLKLLVDWPQSLLDPDVFFLIPIAWMGSVITPLIISFIMVISAILILRKTFVNRKL